MNPDDTVARHGIPAYPIRRNTWRLGYTARAGAPTHRDEVKSALGRVVPTFFVLLKAIYALVIRMPVSLCKEVLFLVRSFRVVRSLDLLIVNGGGQLTGWGGPWAFTYTVYKWVALARLARVRCYILNVGVGPLTQPLSKFFARRALSAADYVSFRDEQSQDLAGQIGYRGRSQVLPDSAYSLLIPALCSGRSSPAVRKPVVGVAPMPYCDPRVFAEKDQRVYEEYISKLGRFTAQLIRNGCAVALLAGDIGIDPLAIEDLQEALRSEGIVAPFRSVTVERVSSCAELWSGMARLDYVVACRFHEVVFAHLLNTPVVALSHHPKISALMHDMGLDRYCVDIRTFDVESLTETCRALENDESEVKSRMARRLADYRERLAMQFDQLFPREAA
jgi:polysaccharide pyruvyl transferase WcaK-like protein